MFAFRQLGNVTTGKGDIYEFKMRSSFLLFLSFPPLFRYPNSCSLGKPDRSLVSCTVFLRHFRANAFLLACRLSTAHGSLLFLRVSVSLLLCVFEAPWTGGEEFLRAKKAGFVLPRLRLLSASDTPVFPGVRGTWKGLGIVTVMTRPMVSNTFDSSPKPSE